MSYELVNFDHEVAAKYHLNSAVTISAGYHWTVAEQDRLNLNNVVLSFRFNLEPVALFLM